MCQLSFPFLRTLAESKPLAALILQALNRQVLEKYKTGRLCFPPPINKELEHLSLAQSLHPRSKSELLDALVVLNKHTMVAYPVGYHLDVFADKEPALENRICFVNPRLGQTTSGGPALGRGGAGGSKFCWELLDWPVKRDRRPAHLRNIKPVNYTA
jgi:hypothetical protein